MDARIGVFVLVLLVETGAHRTTVNNSTVGQQKPTNSSNFGNNTSEADGEATAFDRIVEANLKERDEIEIHEFDMRFPVARSDAPEGDLMAPIRDRSALWPSGVIPFEFGNSIKHQGWFINLVKAAMREWEAKTCIKFREKTFQDSNYVHIYIGHGCNSDVGMVGGRQTVSLGNGCAHRSVILHELGHVVGFWHEQNRPDRDKYVRIERKNIIKNLYYAFHKYSTHKIDSLGVPYDYNSIMHYSRKAFTKNGKDTIVALDGKTKRFGNEHLSSLDVIQANRLYNCPDKTDKYPNFPEDFRFSFSRLSSHECTLLYEPHDAYWRNVNLCCKSGRKHVKIRWSYKGKIPQMRCTKVYSPMKHYYLGWNDNYLCVPKKSPYNFKWSTRGPVRGYKCMQWKYTSDHRWGSGKYLCAKSDDKPVDGGWSPWSPWSQCTKKCGKGFQNRKRECTNPEPKNGGRTCHARSYETTYCNRHKCEDIPKWPEDFTYRYHPYTPSSTTCIRTYERHNYFKWTNYYFCSRSERRDINMKWSDNGPIRHMKCVLINEPQEARRNGWYNNYLCVPRNSPYNFRWSYSGPIQGLSCLQWVAKGGRDGWGNNYLCAEKSNGKQTVATTARPRVIHGGWSSWGPWSQCSKTCGRGTRTRYRSCSNPYPQNGGRTCSGGRGMSQNCNTHECPSDCKFKLTGHSGTFRSPNDRGQIACTWTIEAPTGYQVRLQFRFFSIGVARSDCRRGSDYVTLRDGRFSSSLLIMSLCGSRLPGSIESTGNIMRVDLKSANNVRRAGFSATWKAVLKPTTSPTVKPQACGGILNQNNGNITTPNYPNKYPPKLECTWVIKVPITKILKLRFLSFDLEKAEDCKYDYVEIRDGSSQLSSLLGKFCGNTLPAEIRAFSNSLWIKFYSDNSQTKGGFKAAYYTTKRSVGGCSRRWRYYRSREDGSEYCYLIRYRRATWSDARRDCRRKRSDLLSIATSKEQWFVRNELMAETKYYELWMGYNDLGREGKWAWSDRSEVNFNNWGGGDPNNGGRRKNEDCGVLKPDGKWNDFPCNHRFMYICKRKIK